jgi:hypothetical protein
MPGGYMAGIYHAEVTGTYVDTDSAVYHCLGKVGITHRF